MPKELTERQLEQLMDMAGIRKKNAQSYYYGRNNIVNRNLAKKGFIQRGINGWEITKNGWEYLNGDDKLAN